MKINGDTYIILMGCLAIVLGIFFYFDTKWETKKGGRTDLPYIRKHGRAISLVVGGLLFIYLGIRW